MADSVISIDRLTLRRRRRVVLDQLTWEVPSGFVGLLGPNGAGKTTLINCLVGLLEPTGGRIGIAGEDRTRLGYVPQRASLPPLMRVSEVVEYAAWLKGVPSRRLAVAAADTIELLDLGALAKRRVRSLSGGERQRVAIAAALAHRPAVLILDEPTVGLDPSHRLAVRRAIKGLQDLHCVLIATHLLEDIEHLCENVGILAGGSLEFTGPVEELMLSAPLSGGGAQHGSPFEIAYESIVNRAGGPHA